MYKKLIIVFAIMFLSSGCSASYTLKINGSDLEETTNIYTNEQANETYNGNNLVEYLKIYKDTSNNKVYYDNQNNKKYDVKFFENDSIKGLSFTNTFDMNSYYKSNSINNCFKEFVIEKNGEFYSLKTNSKCDSFDNYPMLEELRINIETDFEVIYDNADSKNGNTYTWLITKDNYKEKSISFSYDSVNNEFKEYREEENKEEETKEDNKKDNNSNNLIIIIGSIAALVLLITSVVLVKKRQL